MGSSPSKGGGGRLFRHQDARGQGDVKLPGSRLRFSKEQVQRLNQLLTRLEQHANHGEFTLCEIFPFARVGRVAQSL
jgi:surfactin synthase thioesterase subunit